MAARGNPSGEGSAATLACAKELQVCAFFSYWSQVANRLDTTMYKMWFRHFAIRRCGVLQLAWASFAYTNIYLQTHLHVIAVEAIWWSGVSRLVSDLLVCHWHKFKRKSVASFNSLCFVLFLDGHRCMKPKARRRGEQPVKAAARKTRTEPLTCRSSLVYSTCKFRPKCLCIDSTWITCTTPLHTSTNLALSTRDVVEFFVFAIFSWKPQAVSSGNYTLYNGLSERQSV